MKLMNVRVLYLLSFTILSLMVLESAHAQYGNPSSSYSEKLKEIRKRQHDQCVRFYRQDLRQKIYWAENAYNTQGKIDQYQLLFRWILLIPYDVRDEAMQGVITLDEVKNRIRKAEAQLRAEKEQEMKLKLERERAQQELWRNYQFEWRRRSLADSIRRARDPNVSLSLRSLRYQNLLGAIDRLPANLRAEVMDGLITRDQAISEAQSVNQLLAKANAERKAQQKPQVAQPPRPRPAYEPQFEGITPFARDILRAQQQFIYSNPSYGTTAIPTDKEWMSQSMNAATIPIPPPGVSGQSDSGSTYDDSISRSYRIRSILHDLDENNKTYLSD